MPDTFFVNEKAARIHDIPAVNSFLRILHSGEILYSSRYVYKYTYLTYSLLVTE